MKPILPCALFVLATAACGGSSDDTADAAADARTGSVDGNTPDAPGADATPPVDAPAGALVIYGLVEGNLVMIDPAVGATATIIGPSAADARFAWDDALSTMFAIVTPYVNPSLGAIDLCTGEVTVGPALTLGGDPLQHAEGIAMRPDGTFFVCVDANGDAPTGVASESVGTVDLKSGAVTLLGSTLDTLQDDCDSLTFRAPSTLYAFDGQLPTAAGVYGVDQTTGAATVVSAGLDGDVSRVAWDPSRSVLWGHRRASRELVTIDLPTGDATVVGVTHASAADSPMFAFSVAPRATCPAVR